MYVLFAVQAIAQTNIKGRVVDESDVGLPGATIAMTHHSDTLDKQYAVTNEAGYFNLHSPKKGRYTLVVSYINYQKLTRSIVVNDHMIDDLVLHMEASQNILSAVTVTAKKKALTIKGGSATMNVESSPLAQSQSAYDLLKNLPGVNVGKDGDIKIKGKSGVVVMIDGEPVEMGSNQLKILLKSTPGATLKSIEVMNHPPASMDATGNAGVINFVFNKKVKKGVNGTISSGLGYGKYLKTDHSLSLSYGMEKWDLDALYAYDYDHSWEKETSFRSSIMGGVETQMNQIQLNPEKSNGHLAKLGVVRNFDDHHMLSFKMTYNGIRNPMSGSTNTQFNRGGILESVQQQQQNIRASTFNNWDGIVKYQHKFDGDRILKSSFQTTLLDVKGKEEFNISQKYGQADQQLSSLRSRYPMNVRTFAFKTDYTHKLSDQWKYEAGIKSGFTKINSSQHAEHVIDGNWVSDPSRQNQFRYQESIQSAYGLLEMQADSWNLRGGLRGEYTFVKGNSGVDNNSVNQNYFSLFPEVELGYIPAEDYKVTLHYNRRIERPDYEQLNPSIKYLDVYTIEKGNPALQPQFSNNLELNQQLFKFVDVTVGYSMLKNPIYYSLIRKDNLESYYTTVNTGKQNQWSASLSFPIPGIDWWENYQSIYAYTTAYNAAVENERVYEKGKSFGVYSYNSFKLPGKVSMEVTGWYQNGGLYANFRYRPMAEVNIGVSRKFISNKLNVGLSASDLFYNSIFNADVVGDKNQVYKIKTKSDSRIFKVSLSWNFGSPGVTSANETKNNAEPGRFPTSKSRITIKPEIPGQ